jgi:hypothetical protein
MEHANGVMVRGVLKCWFGTICAETTEQRCACIVAVTSILNVKPPKSINRFCWKRGFLKLIGGEVDELPSDLYRLQDPYSYFVSEIGQRMQATNSSPVLIAPFYF